MAVKAIGRSWATTAGNRLLRWASADQSDGKHPSSPGRDEIETFLFREARLLDDRHWADWLDLWAEDASYSMPTRGSVLPTDATRSIAAELTSAGGAWWFDESRGELTARIAKITTGKAWAEEPPSRTRRHVGNVEVLSTLPDGVLEVASNVLIYRGRRDSEIEWFSCARTDRLVVLEDGLRIAGRRVVIDANVLPADNLMLFF